MPLHRACAAACAKARSLVPELPKLQCGSALAVQQVESLVASAEKKLHLSRWKERMQLDVAKVRTYVKRKADEQLAFEQEPPSVEDVGGAWHPGVAVHEQARKWSEAWTVKKPPDLTRVDWVLGSLPRPPEVSLSIEVGAEELRSATLVMKHKAAGADDWLPCDIAALPRAWFNWAALIWDRILAQGQAPSIWRRARVALIWKSRRGTRPITLLNAIWRAGARVIQSQLKPWAQSWCDHRTAGGVAGTSVQHALMHIRKAIADEASCFVKLDIASFFDSIQLPILQRALQHLRFPPSVMSVLLDFYAGAERVFTLAGAHTPEWAAIDCGLAQGCPLSPVLASALSHLWASYVASDGIHVGLGLWPTSMIEPCGCARDARSAACGMPSSGLPSSTVPSASLCLRTSALSFPECRLRSILPLPRLSASSKLRNWRCWGFVPRLMALGRC